MRPRLKLTKPACRRACATIDVVQHAESLREEFLRSLQCFAVAQVSPATTGTTNVASSTGRG
jgi:hypothetical protein